MIGIPVSSSSVRTCCQKRMRDSELSSKLSGDCLGQTSVLPGARGDSFHNARRA
jgi:hypothetical protein